MGILGAAISVAGALMGYRMYKHKTLQKVHHGETIEMTDTSHYLKQLKHSQLTFTGNLQNHPSIESDTTVLQQLQQDRLREIAETELSRLRNVSIDESTEYNSSDEVMMLSRAVQLWNTTEPTEEII
ncbi:MAG: hypothetical protein MRQ09_05265 [Candidatus Midichloria sp.]|nr:hypothetical protein [Candidatus Midichloria sp.]